MLDFMRQLALGIAVMIPALSGLARAARLSGDAPAARRPSATVSSAEVRLRALRDRGVMLQQLNHAQMLDNMSDNAMWRSYYQQQDMIRAQR
jgi:hypothetical protein